MPASCPPALITSYSGLAKRGTDSEWAGRSALGDLQADFYGKDFEREGFEVRVLAGQKTKGSGQARRRAHVLDGFRLDGDFYRAALQTASLTG